jgi:hypothetical protein
MITHFIVKENIAQNQVDVILSMLKSWDINANVEKVEMSAKGVSVLPFSAGLWADYDIDDKMLRAKAWGAHKRNVQ